MYTSLKIITICHSVSLQEVSGSQHLAPALQNSKCSRCVTANWFHKAGRPLHVQGTLRSQRLAAILALWGDWGRACASGDLEHSETEWLLGKAMLLAFY